MKAEGTASTALLCFGRQLGKLCLYEHARFLPPSATCWGGEGVKRKEGQRGGRERLKLYRGIRLAYWLHQRLQYHALAQRAEKADQYTERQAAVQITCNQG